jgi:TolB-like protein
MRTALPLPGAGMDRQNNELACRRLMSCLFEEKAEAVRMLLLHSADLGGSPAAEPLPDAAFEQFMAAAYGRADAIREIDLTKENSRRFPTYLKHSPLIWGLAAAALIALIILGRGVFGTFLHHDKNALSSGSDPSYHTASESTRIATVQPGASAPKQSAQNVPAERVAGTTARPIEIAVPRFAALSTEDQELGRTLAQTISGKLGGSGSFTIIGADAYGDRQSEIGQVPAWSQWRRTGAQALLVGGVVESGDSLEIMIRLWDVSAGKQLLERRYTTARERMHDAADDISALIREQLTRREGK